MLPTGRIKLVVRFHIGSSSIASFSTYILYPDYSATEPQILGLNAIFGGRFGAPFQSVEGNWSARPLSIFELISCYSIHDPLLSNSKLWFEIDECVYTLIPGYVSFYLSYGAAESYMTVLYTLIILTPQVSSVVCTSRPHHFF